MIYSVSIITKQGRALLARQFTNLTRSQVEGHLGAFPKLLSSSIQSYIETENIRYVFQDIGDLYFILITSKDSNILEDLDLLSQLLDLTREIINDNTINADLVLDNSLELVFAFDECIFDGYRQNVTVSEVTNFMKMESIEEDDYNRIKKEKEQKAAEQMKARLKEIDSKKKADKKNNILASNHVSAPMQNFSYTQEEETHFNEPPPKILPRRQVNSNKGMMLGRKVSARDKAQQMILEEGLTPEKPKENSAHGAPPPPPQPVNGMEIRLQESFNASVGKNGTVNMITVEGSMKAESNARAIYQIQLDLDQEASAFRTRPMNQKDRKLFAQEKQLVYDSTSNPEETTLLCWRMAPSNPEANDLPFSISCWITESKGKTTFSCDVDFTKEKYQFKSVVLSIPVDHPSKADISVQNGEVNAYERNGIMQWDVEIQYSNESQLEFSVPNCDEESFFPITVDFVAEAPQFPISINSVSKVSSDGSATPTEYNITTDYKSGTFEIVYK